MQTPIRKLLSLGLIAAVSFCGSISAESLPAVDGANGKLSLSGVLGDNDGYAATGSYTVPLSHRYGLQLDGIAANLDVGGSEEVEVLGAGFHAFWRDPSKGLIGIVGSYVSLKDGLNADIFQGGVEGAIYRGRFSLDAIAGVTAGDVIDSDLFLRTLVSYYPTDNTNLQLGYGFQNDDSSLLYGGEIAFDTQNGPSSSLYLSGKLREGGNNYIETGLRIYFGKSGKPLIRRHREDDPMQLLRPVNIDDWICGTDVDPRTPIIPAVARLCAQPR
ncbi:hypothetical protein [uncultured Ruegeria sp.]|uniref:hypothetical protein n=1 Tax=uncultured Ruegeria sp. TaxID=259304 RepID=UPI00260D365D|nr:hypothetical protein [uncultured Ruegeria sp.]